ncbi:16S rRNA (adenine(1518)-N(6)/adenine(1519)-N(6))-dimethyltransferase RsmA [Thiohalocapsa marina]|nr:16S rRNA (adenine(1518)-N(6)/adenine(1519)-N(6))-dimethyltransferase RsmA [Thiohalocapsa marina]
MEHRPRKRFGQNFLHDPGSIRRIIDAVAPLPGQRLVEIGPGRGAITEGLLQAAGALDVIELDRDLVAPLAQRLGGLGRLRVHNADALTFDLCGLSGDPEGAGDSGPRLRLVGNLPYNISTPLLFRFLDQAHCIEDMHLMLQKEVVDRLCAEPGGKTYGRLSVMVQTWCQAERLFVIGPGAFTPAPKVDSAVVRLIPHRPLPHPVDDPALHRRIVAAAFSQRRKTLRNTLSGLATTEQLQHCGIDPGARAESLAVADYVRLANALHQPPPARQADALEGP